jgi:hypothetical protein
LNQFTLKVKNQNNKKKSSKALSLIPSPGKKEKGREEVMKGERAEKRGRKTNLI